MAGNTVTRKVENKARTGAFIFACACLLLGLGAVAPPHCLGMEALTQEEMGDMSGATGITLTFINPVTVRATFTALTYGDGDGWGDATSGDNNPGWLVLIGSGSNTATLSVTIPAASQLDIDVGSTGASACSPAGGAPYAGISIPANTSFFTFSLTETTIGLVTPTTIRIGLSQNAYSAGDLMGYMLAENVMIDKASMKSTCYIWPH